MDEVDLEALRRREAGAIEAFRALAIPRLIAMCERMLGAGALAEEVAEDLCIDFLMGYLPHVQSAKAVPAYLRVMAVRRCSRLRRRQALAQDLFRSDAALTLDYSTIREAEVHLDARHLERCLSSLPVKHRRILKLRFFGGHTQEEIGAAMEMSKQYVGRVIRVSLEALNRCLTGGA